MMWYFCCYKDLCVVLDMNDFENQSLWYVDSAGYIDNDDCI